MMRIKELFEKHAEIDNAINSKLEMIEELKCLATRVTASVFAGSGGDSHSDRVGKTTARIMDLENEINEDIDRLVDVKMEIKGLISAVSSERDRTILERRYILGENWERIAEKMGYSPRHIKRMHGKIVEDLEKIQGGAA